MKKLKIYAEWTLNGDFFNDIFFSWAAFHAATFNPDIELKHMHVLK